MTEPARFQSPAAPYVHRLDRHMVVGSQRWTPIDPAGLETVVCSLACVVTVACRWLPADVAANSGETTENAA